MEKQVQELEMIARGGDEAERASVASEIERLTEHHKNLATMLLSLWTDFNLCAKGTVGDGNCGMEMLMSFQESTVSAGATGELASRNDVLKIIKAHRMELAAMWQKVRADPFWLEIWKVFVHGKADKKPWMRMEAENDNGGAQATPSPKKKGADAELAFTPEKHEQAEKVMQKRKQGKLLGEHAEQPLEEVVVAIPEADSNADQPLKKKKRTGKAKDPSEIITFEKYLPRFLAENHMTSRSWIDFHRKEVHLMFPGCNLLQGGMNHKFSDPTKPHNTIPCW